MYLSINEILDYTDEEREKWRQWFVANGDEKLKIPLANETHKTIGGLILHIFWSELFYAFWMKGKSLTEDDDRTKKYKEMNFEKIENVFDLGRFARSEMRSFAESATAASWDNTLEYSGYGFHIKGTARQLISHILVHEIRHWSQVAVIVREKGFAPPGDHDLIFCKTFGTTIEKV